MDPNNQNQNYSGNVGDPNGTSPVPSGQPNVVQPQPNIVQPTQQVNDATLPPTQFIAEQPLNSQPIIVQPDVGAYQNVAPVVPNIQQPIQLQPVVVQPQQPAAAQVVQPGVSNYPQAAAQNPVVNQSVVDANTQVQMGVQPLQQVPTNAVQPSDNKKQPLVTLVAKLTFKGTEDNAPKTIAAKIIGVVIIVIALLASGGNVYFARHIESSRQALKEYSNPNAAQKEKDKKQAIKDSEPETQDLKDGKIDASKLFDAGLAQRPQDIKAEQNKQVNMSNGQTYAVTKVERGWLPKGQYDSKPAKGKEFVKVSMQVGYRGKEGQGSIYNYKVLNSKGGLQDQAYVYSSEKGEENGLENPALSPGDVAEGWLFFEVDKGEIVNLVYETKGYDYERDNGKEFSIKSTVEIK